MRDGAFTQLAYSGGARCAATWVELPAVREFKETLEVSSDDSRLLLSYPTGFARGILSTLKCSISTRLAIRSVPGPVLRGEPLLARLKHFHACITDGTAPRTPLAAARHDIALIIDIIGAYNE